MGYDKQDCIVCYLVDGFNDCDRSTRSAPVNSDSSEEDHSKYTCGSCIEKILVKSYSRTGSVWILMSDNLHDLSSIHKCFLCLDKKHLAFMLSCSPKHKGKYAK